jgi:hypothetical protein
MLPRAGLRLVDNELQDFGIALTHAVVRVTEAMLLWLDDPKAVSAIPHIVICFAVSLGKLLLVTGFAGFIADEAERCLRVYDLGITVTVY